MQNSSDSAPAHLFGIYEGYIRLVITIVKYGLKNIGSDGTGSVFIIVMTTVLVWAIFHHRRSDALKPYSQ